MTLFTLTDSQQIEAEEAYIEARLSEDDKAIKESRTDIEKAMGMLRAELEELEKECTHPLIARVIKNLSDSGNWDRGQDSYWTSHHCTICDKRWDTTQSWSRVGGKHGHPDDLFAKEENA